MTYIHIEQLVGEIEIPSKGTLSRTVANTPQFKAVLFAFDRDEALSEHTASMPAIIQILEGEAELTLGVEKKEAIPGTFISMEANLPHSVHARTPLIMLLILLKS